MLLLAGCGGSTSDGSNGNGGGGSPNGGSPNGGSPNGGSSNGGSPNGGSPNGGTGNAGGSVIGGGGCSGTPECGGGTSVCCDAQGTEQPVIPDCQCGHCPPGTDMKQWATCNGCFGNFDCDALSYCETGDTCLTLSGQCLPLPASCPTTLQPVCGCDHKLYDNPCSANMARQSVSSSHSCFACGSATCTSGSEYCEFHAGAPAQSSCKPLPSGCSSPPSCACLASVSCGDKCFVDSSGLPYALCP